MSVRFDSFTFTFTGSPNQYAFTYSLSTGETGYRVEAYINGVNVGTPVTDQPSATINVLEADSPIYFTQGYTIAAKVTFVSVPVTLDSTILYYVFQRKTDANNININGNTKYIYAFKNTPQIKSIVLAPISQSPCCSFFFKYLGQSQPASVCAYMTNTSYPIANSSLISTSSDFSGVFDSRVNGSFGTIIFDTSLSNACISIFNNTSNWYTGSAYVPSASLTYGTSSSQSGALFDASNSQILYHQYTTKSTIVLCNSPPSQFPKFIFFRNTTSVSPAINVRIFAPPTISIDSTTPTTGNSAFVSFSLAQNEQRTVGMYYNDTDKIYYVLTSYNSSGLTTSNVLSYTTLSNTFGLINDQDKNVQITLPVQQYGYAKINTIAFIEGNPTRTRSLTLSAPLGNNIILPSGMTATVNLSNSGANIAYTFASFYNGPSSNSVTFPLYNSAF